MKHFVLIIAIFFGLQHAVSAQTTKKQTKKEAAKAERKKVKANTYQAPPSGKDSTLTADSAKRKVLTNNRRIFHWKDGQRATPTGHEATGVGAGYSALKKRPKPLAKDTLSPKKARIPKKDKQ